MNPTIQPYDIIKASFYQSSKIGKMQKLFDGTLEQIDNIKNQLSQAKAFFDIDYIKNQKYHYHQYDHHYY